MRRRREWEGGGQNSHTNQVSHPLFSAGKEEGARRTTSRGARGLPVWWEMAVHTILLMGSSMASTQLLHGRHR